MVSQNTRSMRAQAHAQRMWDRREMVSVGDGGGVRIADANVALCGGVRVAVGVGVRRRQS